MGEKYTTWKVSVFGVILVRMRENADQNNSEYGQFLCSDKVKLFWITIDDDLKLYLYKFRKLEINCPD